MTNKITSTERNKSICSVCGKKMEYTPVIGYTCKPSCQDIKWEGIIPLINSMNTGRQYYGGY